MMRKMMSRYFVLTLIVLMMALVTGCGGGDDGRGVAKLSQGRWGHTATLLEDGRVLVVGGQETRTVALATAEVYDSVTGTWSSAGATNENRGEGHTATLLEDGRVLVVGDGESAELYDPSTGIWSSAGSMSGERTWHTATLLEDGRVLVAGGLAGRLALDTAEVYDPSTGEWSLAGNMSEKYDHHAAAILPDGRVLLLGRFGVDIYDPSTDIWSSADKPLTRERFFGYPVIVLEDGRVMIPGGAWTKGGYGAQYVAMPEVDIYDPSTGTWSVGTPMQEGRRSHPATLLEDGRVLVIANRSMEIYDPTTDSWSSAGEMKTARTEQHTATLLQDGTVLVVGGKKDTKRNLFALFEGGSGRSDVEIYDPAAGW